MDVRILWVVIDFLHPIYFCCFIIQLDYPYLVKWYINVKWYLNSSFITCLDNVKHVNQYHDYENLNIFCLFRSHILGLFLNMNDGQIIHLTFNHSLRFALVVLLGAINQANLIKNFVNLYKLYKYVLILFVN